MPGTRQTRWAGIDPREHTDNDDQSDPTTAPSDVVERVREAQRLRHAEEDARIARELQAVKERFRNERAALVPADVERQLREYRTAHRPLDRATVTEEERRQLGNEFRAFARSLGVDIPALCRMQADFEAASTAVVEPRRTGEVKVSDWSPEADQPAATQSFDGWWDVGRSYQTTRPSHTSIWNAESFLDGISLMGSHVRYRISDVDDSDSAFLAWTNGYMRLFTMPFNGYLAVDMFLIGHHSKHFIDTDDEDGFSSCTVSATQHGIGEVYADGHTVELRGSIFTVFAQSRRSMRTASSSYWSKAAIIATQ